MTKSTVSVDEELLREAMKVAKTKSKSELVRMALVALIDAKKRRGMLALGGKVRWEGDLRALREGRS
jgi:Arc/MetJ family transcription regulator